MVDTEKKPPLIWLNIGVFSISMLLAVLVAPWYGYQFGYGVEHLIWLVVTFSFCNLSITAGYHRLWAHKAYEAHPIIRVVYALGGAFALQNSALHWSSDHRVHHRHVDVNDKDPYSAKKGFWFSHIGWMLRHYNKTTYSDYSNCRDLQKDPIVMWQHKHYLLLAIAMNVGVPVLLGLLHGDVWGMLLVTGAVRLVLNHHTTFFINSLAHIWGSQPYTDKNTARDNGFLAFLTFGEGYHNYHHIFENDYRNGIHWWQYDPTKWMIRLFSLVGLASKLTRCPAIRIERARIQMQLRKAKENIQNKPQGATIIDSLQSEYDALWKQMQEYYEVKKQLMEAKKTDLTRKYEASLLKVRYQQVRATLKTKQKSWDRLVAQYA
ncbi:MULTISPECIES: fatty acid desaturase [Vibrio]|uniref:acyl-CoA desaturase n=2 Tax=Vibrio TaxID=662 RepID=UPI0015E1482D|nr:MULTISPECIES: fatty acid desaturase [Vibrio]MDP2572085.1 fatty acid desaturase [Vibrio penaeicida]